MDHSTRTTVDIRPKLCYTWGGVKRPLGSSPPPPPPSPPCLREIKFLLIYFKYELIVQNCGIEGSDVPPNFGEELQASFSIRLCTGALVSCNKNVLRVFYSTLFGKLRSKKFMIRKDTRRPPAQSSGVVRVEETRSLLQALGQGSLIVQPPQTRQIPKVSQRKCLPLKCISSLVT